MDEDHHDRDLARRANELYWGSDESVNRIAERLDLSKSTLYDLVGPLMSGSACPVCGTETDFPNRTARQRDQLVCPVCGWEGSTDEADALGAEGEIEASGAGGAIAVAGSTRQMLLAGALIGAAAGLAWFTVRRRGG